MNRWCHRGRAEQSLNRKQNLVLPHQHPHSAETRAGSHTVHIMLGRANDLQHGAYQAGNICLSSHNMEPGYQSTYHVQYYILLKQIYALSKQNGASGTHAVLCGTTLTEEIERSQKDKPLRLFTESPHQAQHPQYPCQAHHPSALQNSIYIPLPKHPPPRFCRR